ncbi:MAG TPA: DUF421 domain-containing protein [Tetrasphaera sp.]|uniref:DUF421 domain-containing protein n=1 Tax=Nostocoides vanveenii TaxID=330835 RepID=A0ABN2L2N9_9MICO|nr:YetF domain-containing protein [Tetrasphaera sp.]HNQ06082.1 DUF421 domain-containing protein [Tetrasphaera sp.]
MELIIRTVVIFFALWLVMRVAGKRQVANMDAFDLVTIIVLGGVVTQGILQEDYSAVSAVVALGLVTLLSVGLSWLGWRFRKVGSVIEGKPTILLRDGRPDLRAMAAERVSEANMFAAAREHGLRSLEDADLIVLEADGAFSFFVRDDSGEADPPDDTKAQAV